MSKRQRPARLRPGSDDNALGTRRIVASLTGRHPETVSRHCKPVACDVRTRALLYDLDEAYDTLAELPPGRPPCLRVSPSSTFLPAVDLCPQDDEPSMSGGMDEDRAPQPWDQMMDLPPGPHLAKLSRWVEQLQRWGLEITPSVWEHMLHDALGGDSEQRRYYTTKTLREISVDPGLVYYLRIGGLIKIGWTSNLDIRLKAYPPNARLLATEMGDLRLEKERHSQFEGCLSDRREWFYPSTSLITHINSLRKTPLSPAELA